MNIDQSAYLEAMGISTWQRRKMLSVETLRYYALTDAKGELVAYLVTEAHSTEEEALLINIVKALEAQLALITPSEMNNENLTQLVFGSALDKILEATKSRIVLFSLSEMLANPALKKEVWLKLKSFRGW